VEVQDPDTGRIKKEKREPKKYIDSYEERELFKRMEMSAYQKKLKLEYLENKIQEELYPFKPKISSKRPGEVLRDELGLDADFFEDGWNEGANPVSAFLQRYEEDLEKRREEFPERYELSDKTVQLLHDRDRRRYESGTISMIDAYDTGMGHRYGELEAVDLSSDYLLSHPAEKNFTI